MLACVCILYCDSCSCEKVAWFSSFLLCFNMYNSFLCYMHILRPAGHILRPAGHTLRPATVQCQQQTYIAHKVHTQNFAELMINYQYCINKPCVLCAGTNQMASTPQIYSAVPTAMAPPPVSMATAQPTPIIAQQYIAGTPAILNYVQQGQPAPYHLTTAPPGALQFPAPQVCLCQQTASTQLCHCIVLN